MHIKTRNVNTAFRTLVETIRKRSVPISSKGSRNGPVLQIDEPVLITYEQPRERVLFNQARDANPFMHVYEALWMLAGQNDVAPLAYYAKQFLEYSDDGETLNGSYGHRWRHYGCRSDRKFITDTDQLRVLIAHLKQKPDSRRAVLQMWNVEDDLLKIDSSKDICCNLSVMFALRGLHSPLCINGGGHFWNSVDPPKCVHCGEVAGKISLDMTVTNRSNDMIWGALGANVVHFSFLQEYVAAHLGVEVGLYHHFTNNMHVYEWNWKPEEWLRDDWVDGARSADSWYRYGDHQFVSLVRDPVMFDEELPRFVENFSGKTPVEDLAQDWKEPFLEEVAQPMLIAFACHKERDYHSAFQADIKADDWRIAAINWLTRRSEKRVK